MTQESIGQRIRQKRNELDLTQSELARKMSNVSHAAISQWESDSTKPNAENLFELAIIFSCDFAWLLKGEGFHSNILPATLNLRGNRIPLISAINLIHCHINTPDKLVSGEYIMTDINVSEKAFAYRIFGDEMEPDFVDGDIVVIDPDVKPRPGEFVSAFCDDKLLVFRKYKEEGINSTGLEIFSLIPLMTDYPILSSEEHKITILGTMVEHRIYRRKRKS
ncbi:helix-turn-helix domain-containing protein [Snodgrassella sp. CFCC 13594]|uniref:helix-turn-helix domain-containing protein n=1 Tax=Snodgrassella sp. CFCC 13594 TaxID=1775559 RepID=UPI00082DF40D|nr:helix-turn-helix domain-containing protein [Snodgrassella sp. CFCC 13594]